MRGRQIKRLELHRHARDTRIAHDVDVIFLHGMTELGQAVVTRYRAIEEDCSAAARKHLVALQRIARARRPE